MKKYLFIFFIHKTVNNRIKCIGERVFGPLIALKSLELEKNVCAGKNYHREQSDNAFLWRREVQADISVHCGSVNNQEDPELVPTVTGLGNKFHASGVLVWSLVVIIRNFSL